MNDVLSQPKAPLEFWRALALTLMGVTFTLCGCIYSEDRDHLTKQDIVPIAANIHDTQEKVDEMRDQLNMMRGQLVAKRVINP
jgi:hypothetical protein